MRKRLNSERRKLIEEHLSSCWCLRRIALALCVVASGVSREVSGHGGAAVYRAGVAQERAARMRAGVGHHRIHHSPPDQGGLGAHARQPAATRQSLLVPRRTAGAIAQPHSEPRPFFPAPAASRRPRPAPVGALAPSSWRIAPPARLPASPCRASMPAPTRRPRLGARHDPREKVGENVSRATARHRRAHQPAPDENPPTAIPKPSRQTIITPPGDVALSMTMCINPRPAPLTDNRHSLFAKNRITSRHFGYNSSL